MVSGTTTITYTQLTSPTQFTGALKFLGHAFTLVAANQSGNPVTQFSNAFTLTLHYADSDWVNAGVANEPLLNLYYWSGSAWVGVLPCAGCTLDMVNNTLTVRLNHLTEFALLAPMDYKLFLPLIRR